MCLVLLLTATPLASQGQEGTVSHDDDAVASREAVATVNGEPLYFEDVARRLSATHSGVADEERGGFDLDRLMEGVINDALLAQEGRTLELHHDARIQTRLEQMRLERALKRLDEEEIWGRVQVTEDELRQLYEKDYATVSLRIVTLAEQDHAKELLTLLRENDADFEAMVRDRSIDQYAGRGGLMDDLPRIDLPGSVAAAAWELEPAQLAGPIRTSLGWSVIRVEAFGEADPEGFDGLRRKLEEQQRFRKAETFRAELGKRLRASLAATVNMDLVYAIEIERQQDGRLMPVAEDPAAPVARIGNRSILAEELVRALAKRWRQIRNEDAALATRPIVFARLLRGELLRIEAVRRGYGDSLNVQRALHAMETQLVIRRYLDELVVPRVQVSDEELSGYYEEHRDEYRKPPRVHLGQITVEDKEEAERLAGLLRQGSDLAWLARQHSIDRFKADGGDRGWLVPVRGLDDLHDHLLAARPGDVLDPMGTPSNWVVVQVDAREEQGHFTQEEVSTTIRAAVFERKFRQYLDEHVAQLRSRSEINIDREVLASMRISGKPAEDAPDASAPSHGHH